MKSATMMPDAATLAFVNHHGEARALARKLTRSDADADDISADAFAALPDAMQRYRGENDAPARSFLMGIVANLARRFRRAHARRLEIHEAVSVEPRARPDDPEASVARSEMVRRLASALDALPDVQREAFLLAAIEDCSAREIASAQRVPEATVRTRIFYARRTLRAAAQAVEDERRIAQKIVTAFVVCLALSFAGTVYAARRPLMRMAHWMGHGLVERLLRSRPAQPRPIAPRAVPALRPPTPRADVGVPTGVVGSDSVLMTVFRSPTSNADVDMRTPVRPTRTEFGADPRYLRAHAIHFRGGDPNAAVEAWTDYLAHARDARWVPDARFNRAVSLLRAHRITEARADLAPFAQGRFGSYHRRDAERLLAALERTGES